MEIQRIFPKIKPVVYRQKNESDIGPPGWDYYIARSERDAPEVDGEV